MLFQGLDVEGFFSRNKIRFSVNLYYNVRIIITIWSANVFYVFPTSEKLWEYFAKQKKNLHFLWNYSLANMTHIKKLHITKNCHEKKIIALVQKLSKTWHFGIKEKKNNLTKKKNHFYEPWRNRVLAFVENRVVRRLMKIVPFGQLYTWKSQNESFNHQTGHSQFGNWGFFMWNQF